MLSLISKHLSILRCRAFYSKTPLSNRLIVCHQAVMSRTDVEIDEKATVGTDFSFLTRFFFPLFIQNPRRHHFSLLISTAKHRPSPNQPSFLDHRSIGICLHGQGKCPKHISISREDSHVSVHAL